MDINPEQTKNQFDEMYGTTDSNRLPYNGYDKWFKQQDIKSLRKKSNEAETIFRRSGITFSVHGRNEPIERLIPFDIVPRIISSKEWFELSRGLEQRVTAINSFIHDVYHGQEIIRAGKIPEDIILNNDAYLSKMIGVEPPGDVYTHIAGVDIIRTSENEFFVLEDNVRTPSGVSYMLENRETMMQMFPELFARVRVKSVSDYPKNLCRSLNAVAPPGCQGTPTIAVLTPGIYNSAYFEHAFLADHMGVELVEGSDLRVVNGKIAMRTILGFQTIDILYRRLDDDYLDPLNFNPESMLGVPGLMDVYKAGNITIANAPGTGIADDKAIYSYMPEIIEFYTGTRPLLNNVPTYRCSEPDTLAFVLDNLSNLVVKEVHGSGGYGMLVGPAASKRELSEFTKKLVDKPRNYIAQPTLALSTVPILVKSGLAPRHVDLRPFVLMSDKIEITPGGLTRVALKESSLVVNSSQGGGTKDTWVLNE